VATHVHGHFINKKWCVHHFDAEARSSTSILKNMPVHGRIGRTVHSGEDRAIAGPTKGKPPTYPWRDFFCLDIAPHKISMMSLEP
jgi:hypothetical protein